VLNPPLSLTSTATVLGLSKSSVVRLVKTGRLGYVRLGDRRIGIPESEVNRFLATRFVPASDTGIVTRSRAGGRA
jgi:excisionase family DNA binding protein